ncbi:MAG: 1-deoxy-D-xylulose-5-phosphate synthase [Bacteroidetes bacterium]|nr:MAG: 1-deoxy-D-xylulose-5-phosphate synthase [Bacteroidota bacterium]
MSDLLKTYQGVDSLRSLTQAELPAFCEELRLFAQVEGQGKKGHLLSSLGVAELSVALHYHFNTPQDILVWDVGHQAYFHKIITGRKEGFRQNRQKEGLSGFTNRLESIFDPFGAGHSSTAPSAIAGFWKAAQLKKEKAEFIAVIGDGAFTGGMSFEALNYLGQEQANVWIIFNDNGISIDENVGALKEFGLYQSLAESLGFQYIHLSEGNSIPALLSAFADAQEIKGPKFLHLKTSKGKGLLEASRPRAEEIAATTSFQDVVEASLMAEFNTNDKLVLLSPAMLAGAQLNSLKEVFPARVIDVGIAEQHVVTMAAAMAAAGLKPIVHIYSTFAQRAIDQIIHDVALQKLAPVFLIDRAGLVGEDGPTHHGAFDISLLSAVPNLRIAAPAGEKALREMVNWSLAQEEACFIRFPKDDIDLSKEHLWKSYRPHWWQNKKQKFIISFGSLAAQAQEAVQNSEWGHLHLPILKPFPDGDILEQLKESELIICLEENTYAGGLASNLARLKAEHNLKGQIKSICLPDYFIAHASRLEQLEELGMTANALKKYLT